MENPFESINLKIDQLTTIVQNSIEKDLNEHGVNRFLYQRLPGAAQTLGVKESTLRSYVRKRKISYRKVGSILFFSYEDLNDFVEKGLVPAKSRFSK